MEASDGLLSASDARLLTGDDTHILDGGIELLGIRCSSADTHVDDDLLELRNEVDVLDVKILLKFGDDLVLVHFLQTRSHVFKSFR